jgi:hypothetical protein
MAAKQRTQAEIGGNILRTKYRFRTERGIVVNDKVLQIKARPRQEAEVHPPDFDLPLQRHPDGGRNARFQASGSRPDQKQHKPKHDAHQHHAAFGT